MEEQIQNYTVWGRLGRGRLSHCLNLPHVEDEGNTEEETENDGNERTASCTSATSLSVLEAATYVSTNTTIMDEPLCPTTSTPVSAIDNANEYYRKKSILLKSISFKNSFHRRMRNRQCSFVQWQKGEAIALESHPCRGTMVNNQLTVVVSE
ncbi:hypothetical protein PoB_000103700 [Plakobranchus ocellatus]|uniref:Uncharacterized protein n=1 Tax=Plakobranchus ocellatus TaxID=259542 RepID=A0AAV3XWL0_9GAST|nr:hypothetical protein PoB_000103700 [Plakobranchus ocellatus]